MLVYFYILMLFRWGYKEEKNYVTEIVLFICGELRWYIAKEDDVLQWVMETEGEGINRFIQKCTKLLYNKLWEKERYD